MAGSALGFTLGVPETATLATYTATPTVLLNGTDVTRAVFTGSAQLTLALGQPKSFTCTLDGRLVTPVRGQSVVIADDGTNATVRWFGGTLTDVSVTIDRTANALRYDCVAQDYRWLIDRYETITRNWYHVGINRIVRDIVDGYTNGGFTVGYVPAALGTLDVFSAVNERVWSVLERLAAAAGAYVDVDADKRVHLFVTPDHQSAGTVSLTNTSNNIAQLRVGADITDIATRVRVIAAGTVTRTPVASGATDLPVVDVTPFGTSGTLLLGTEYLSYTGTTTTVGAEAVTCSSGAVHTWPTGTPVRPVAVANDTAAQTALETALGAGLSGIATRAVDDDRLGRSEAEALATSTLALLSGGVTTVAGGMVDAQHTGARNCWPGASLVCSLTSPVTVGGTYRIQQVALSPLMLNGAKTWARMFQAAPVSRGHELLQTLGAAEKSSRFVY